MKRPLFIFTLYLFVFMTLAAAIGPMTEDDATTLTTVARTEKVQIVGSD